MVREDEETLRQAEKSESPDLIKRAQDRLADSKGKLRQITSQLTLMESSKEDLKNAGHLNPLDWNEAPLEDRVTLLEAAGQDINLAPLAFDQLSLDVKVAMGRELDQMAAGALSNDGRSPAGKMPTFVFQDAEGESVQVAAKDEASAWNALSRDLGAPLADLKGMGVKLIREIENSLANHLEQLESGKWRVLSEHGSKHMGDYDTKAEAEHRLQQIEIHKNADPEGDLEEIARHADGARHEAEEIAEGRGTPDDAAQIAADAAGIEHEVSELQEEGLANKDISKSEVGEEIAHHIEEKGMPQKQAVAVALREAGISRKSSKDDPLEMKNSGVRRGSEKYGSEK